MKRAILGLFLVAACGDNLASPLDYTNPDGGKLRLVRDPLASTKYVILDLVVGAQPLTGYSVGFDLPFDDTKVTFTAFTPGKALDPFGKIPEFKYCAVKVMKGGELTPRSTYGGGQALMAGA